MAHCKIPQPLPSEATTKDATRWVRNLVRFIGPGFHPDSRFSDYVKDDGSCCFTLKESRYLEKEMKLAWEILENAGIEIYSVALQAQRRLLLESH